MWLVTKPNARKGANNLLLSLPCAFSLFVLSPLTFFRGLSMSSESEDIYAVEGGGKPRFNTKVGSPLVHLVMARISPQKPELGSLVGRQISSY